MIFYWRTFIGQLWKKRSEIIEMLIPIVKSETENQKFILLIRLMLFWIIIVLQQILNKMNFKNKIRIVNIVIIIVVIIQNLMFLIFFSPFQTKTIFEQLKIWNFDILLWFVWPAIFLPWEKKLYINDFFQQSENLMGIKTICAVHFQYYDNGFPR